jgi:hypothetical protein
MLVILISGKLFYDWKKCHNSRSGTSKAKIAKKKD